MRGEGFYNPEREKMHQFSELRKKAHEQIEKETAERIKNNPVPAEEEIMVGAFREMLEPQIRDAVFEFFKKGYATESSGFRGDIGDEQSMDGYFEIDNEAKEKIEALGAKVLKGAETGLPYQSEEWASIRFKAENPDLKEIKQKWDQIAEIMPDKGEPALPSISGGSEDFRKQYAPDRTDVEKSMLEKRLELGEYGPETEKEMKERLEEI